MSTKTDNAEDVRSMPCYPSPVESPQASASGTERGAERAEFPPVLDVCCGGRMMWFNPDDERGMFVDIRKETVQRSEAAQRKSFKALEVNPDVQADFTDLPFPSDSFALVVFDPPHMTSLGANSFMAKEYGRLFGDWRDMLRKGFEECFRVLKPEGTLVFKWNEYDVPVSEILALTPERL